MTKTLTTIAALALTTIANATAQPPTTTLTEEEANAIIGTLNGTIPEDYGTTPEPTTPSMVPLPAMWECIQLPDRTESVVLSMHMDDTDRVTIFDDNGVFVRRERIVFYGVDKKRGSLYGFDWTENEGNWSFRFYREDDETMIVEISNATSKEPWAKLMCH